MEFKFHTYIGLELRATRQPDLFNAELAASDKKTGSKLSPSLPTARKVTCLGSSYSSLKVKVVTAVSTATER